MVDALYDRLTVPRDSDRPLRAVGQHLTGNLDTGPGHLNICIRISVKQMLNISRGHLSNFLDLAAPFADEGPALAGGDYEAKCDGWAGNSAGADQIV